MRRRLCFAAVFFTVIALPAFAQAPAAGTPERIRGTIVTRDGQALSVKERDGDTTTVTLTPGVAVETLVKRKLSDIKPGDFVASTGVKDQNGKIHAIEVRIFPKAARNGGRQFAWDLSPDSVMTNATVGKVTEAPEGEILHVTFKGGASEYSVGPGVPVLAAAPGNVGLLKPGATVFVIARKHPDGSLTSSRLYVEANGIKPPM